MREGFTMKPSRFFLARRQQGLHGRRSNAVLQLESVSGGISFFGFADCDCAKASLGTGQGPAGGSCLSVLAARPAARHEMQPAPWHRHAAQGRRKLAPV